MNTFDFAKKNDCPKISCNKDCCPVFSKVVIPASMGSDDEGQPFAPENGAYQNALVYYEASGVSYIYSSDGLYTKIAQIEGGQGEVISVNGKKGVVVITLSELGGKTQAEIQSMINGSVSSHNSSATAHSSIRQSVTNEATARSLADNNLQGQIDALAAASDVTDIVGTYAELQSYDTSKLKNNDIIKVLQDETHDDETTYYRWSTSTEVFTLIGEEGPYYTKSAADQKFQEKLIAGTNISIASDGKTISSTASQTIFYESASASGNTRSIYKKSNMTDPVTAQDLLDANEKGQVILRLSTASTPEYYSDAYLQNTYTGNADYQFLFLNERSYRQFDATSPSDTTFYFTASEIQLKLSAGSNISITGNTISATDTTYSDFTGTDGVNAGVHGLVPAPATTDAGKFLKADGTWATAGGGGPTVVQTTGTSTTDVMSQNATTSMVYADPSTKTKVQIGNSTSGGQDSSVSIGTNITADGNRAIAIGERTDNTIQTASGPSVVSIGVNTKATQSGAVALSTRASATGQASTAIGVYSSASRSGAQALGYYSNANGDNSLAIGYQAQATGANSIAEGNESSATSGAAIALGSGAEASEVGTVALGAHSRATRQGEVNVGTGNTYGVGYNLSLYRLISGVYDGQAAHDAATVGQLDARVAVGAGAPTTSTVGTIGKLYEDTTNGKLYICTAVSGSTYTWAEVSGGTPYEPVISNNTLYL